MAINFQQTDTAAVQAPGAFCSSRSANGQTAGRRATDGGSAGISQFNIVLDNPATTLWCATWDIPIDAGVSWDAGTWTVRINFTQGDKDVTLEEVFICRVDSGGTSQGTIGSNTGIGFATNTTGVRTESITGSAQTPSAGDTVQIVMVFSNSNNMGTNQFGITPDQLIDSPFTAPASAIKPLMMQAF